MEVIRTEELTEMDSTGFENLKVTTYNCEYANNIRLPFMKNLFSECDFLLIQEHGLFESKLSWFHNLEAGVGVHGVSAMKEDQLIRGRPHGGAAIIWHGALCNHVKPIPWDSTRLCAVTVNIGSDILLLVCIYMPCDDNRNDKNVVEYKEILNDISILCHSTNANFLCISGDFNTDLSRDSPQTHALNLFTEDNDLFCCANGDNLLFDYTYCSKINGCKTFIDHFVISNNLKEYLDRYDSIDSVENPSDHVASRCTFKFSLQYNDPATPVGNIKQPLWDSASDNQIELYKEYLDHYLLGIELPTELINCNDVMCTKHNKEITDFHDKIVYSLIYACNDCIPTSKFKKKAAIPGWNDNIEHYFRTALYWHKVWVDNGRPEDGIYANLRRITRAHYHKARKFVIKHKDIVASEKLAESLENDSPKEFWKNIKKNSRNKTHLPCKVDDKHNHKDISDIFKDRFDELFNSVSYSNYEMNSLKGEINNSIINTCVVNENSRNFMFDPENISKAISKLKAGKQDGSVPLTSDNIIYSTDVLNGHLALLFSVMVKHGFSPDGMLVETMVPLPKGRWNLSNSSNYRAITVSSLLGKLLDHIILEKEAKNLMTNDLQFSFKPGLSTTMCSTMVRETISYFVNRNTNVYGLVLDATKAFDRLNYCKLFRVLLSRNVNPLICRLLLNMYIDQKLRVKWENTLSDSFTVTNGVKQGGVISPILFCVYMDGLISELESSQVGCWMGAVFAGTFVYADDIKLLAPSIRALNLMLKICKKYAEQYDVLFNDKSKLIVFKAISNDDPPPFIEINRKQIESVDSIDHLGHILNSNIFNCDASKCTRDLYIQCNSLLGNFNNATSNLRNYLFFKYCNSFYGSQFLPLYDNTMDAVYVAWRNAVRRVWRVPPLTHCNILPHLTGVMPPELSFAKRAISFTQKLLTSKNKTVNMITGMGIYGTHSILGANVRHLKAKYNMNCKVVDQQWNTLCHGTGELKRKCEQIKELCYMRDTYNTGILSRNEVLSIINLLCTE